MSERYLKLASIDKNQYCAGSPVVIAAGSLLKDNETGKVLVQLKFSNISNKTIKALIVKIDAYDISGNQLAGVPEYQYLDLAAKRGDFFGQKSAIELPGAVTRSVCPVLISVIFSDGTSWNNPSKTGWDPIPDQQKLEEGMTAGLAAQYRRETVSLAEYIPMSHEDLWMCTCGAINHAEESCCHACKSDRSKLLSLLNQEDLAQNLAEYEQQMSILLAERKAKAAEEEKKQKKTIIIGLLVAAIIVLIISVGSTVVNKMNREREAYVDAYLEGVKESAFDKAYATFKNACQGNMPSSMIPDVMESLEVTYISEEVDGDEFIIRAKYSIMIPVVETFSVTLTPGGEPSTIEQERIETVTSRANIYGTIGDENIQIDFLGE